MERAMRIRFLSEQVYEQGGPSKGPRFPKDFVLDANGIKEALGMDEDPSDEWKKAFLNRWTQRRVAVEVDDRTPASDANLAVANAGAPLPDDLDRMSRSALDELASARGVDISAAKNKVDVIKALQASVDEKTV